MNHRALAHRRADFIDVRNGTICCTASRSLPRSFADCARELLEAGASPLPANTQGISALHYAAARGHSACIHLLLTAPVQLPGGAAFLS